MPELAGISRDHAPQTHTTKSTRALPRPYVGAQVVLCFWMWLLYSEKQRKKIRGRQYGAGVDAGPRPGSSGAAAPRRKGAAANWADWRTPKDILASWGKQGDKYKLEKV